MHSILSKFTSMQKQIKTVVGLFKVTFKDFQDSQQVSELMLKS